MGIYLNENNVSYLSTKESEIFIDKSGLIKYLNKVLGKEGRFICNSRPRRFGKSTAANMLSAYYSKGSDSKELFSDLDIAKDTSFETYLNKYDTFHIDIQSFFDPTKKKENVVSNITKSLMEELKEEYSSIISDKELSLQKALALINSKTGKQFVFIIDEWDVLIREADESIASDYINFLRLLFKSAEASKYIALAYLTGILPIKKIQTQSALNNFREYTVLNPGFFAPYFGFTKDDVQTLCNKFGRNYEEIKRWYDGYLIEGEHIYNPQSVVYSIESKKTQSYWSNTASFEAIVPYINMNYEGLKDDILKMLSGVSVPVNVSKFSNDLNNVRSRDEVLTLLIHLGYLSYNECDETAFVPNEEVRRELYNAVEECNWNEFISFKNRSDKLLEATLLGNEEYVEKILEEIHSLYSSALTYNDENSLATTILVGYLSSMNQYYYPIREFPSGNGFCDIVYIPKPQYVRNRPALLIELKWDKSTKTAINQIKEKNYPASLIGFSDNLLLVAATYDKKTKKHSVKIERIE